MDDSYEKRVQNQFGAFCIKVLKNEANRIRNEQKRQLALEQSMVSLSADQLCEISSNDEYFRNEHIFEVYGMQVVVSGDSLAKILAELPEKKRNIILLYYFLGMRDWEIADRMHVVRQAVSKSRGKILQELRRRIEAEGGDFL